MRTPIHLEYPFRADAVRELRVGQPVRLHGRVVMARDRVIKRLYDAESSPVDLTDGAIYHCSPLVMGREGHWVVRAAGPATSPFAELHMPTLMERHQVRVVIGKGGMGPAGRRACKKVGAVYLQAVGGAGKVVASRIQRVEQVFFLKEFGSAEAMWTLWVADLEAVVAVDVHGWSLHDRIQRSSRAQLKTLLTVAQPEADPAVSMDGE